MELDISKFDIAKLHQLYGEVTLQLELLSQKKAQVQSQILKVAKELQEREQQIALLRASKAQTPEPELPKSNGATPPKDGERDLLESL